MNPRILRLLLAIGDGEASAEELAARLSVSPATFKRDVGELRRLGADVAAFMDRGGGWRYRTKNWRAVQERARIWLELEEEQTLLDLRSAKRIREEAERHQRLVERMTRAHAVEGVERISISTVPDSLPRSRPEMFQGPKPVIVLNESESEDPEQ